MRTTAIFPGRYVQGDGAHLPFKDNSFDVVVTSDVYEHVPPEIRERFLDNLLRVSRGYVILGAPFYSERNALAERMAYEYVRKVLHARHHQLQEHIENRLPDPVQFNGWLKARGLDYTTFDGGDLNSWLMMMFLRHYLMSVPGTEKLQSMLDRYYNMSFYESDHGPDGYGYRKVFVIAGTGVGGSKAVIGKIGRHFKNYIDNNKNQRLDNTDMSHIRMLLDLEVLQTRAQLEEKDGVRWNGEPIDGSPDFIAPSSTWEGDPSSAFDSRRFSGEAGYRSRAEQPTSAP